MISTSSLRPVRGETRLPGPRRGMGRLGVWAAAHLRAVLLTWLAVLVLFGFFAPQVESSLAGAGWQDSTSQSVAARNLIQRDFHGLGSSALQVVVVDQRRPLAGDPAAQVVLAKVTALLKANKRVSTVVEPQTGVSLSRDGRTGIITAGAAASTDAMVAAADKLAGPLQAMSSRAISVTLTGDSALWADFNSANRSAMMRSELSGAGLWPSWPLPLAAWWPPVCRSC